MRDQPMRLKPGKFYLDTQGKVWCCFRIMNGGYLARCIRLYTDEYLDFFSLAGECQNKIHPERTLVRELEDREVLVDGESQLYILDPPDE